MKKTKSTFQYGIHMLPVVVNSVLNKQAGLGTLREFLLQARGQLEAEIESCRRDRVRVTRQTSCRRERMHVGRYFDLAQRAYKARRLALEAVEKHFNDGEGHWLEQALRQYETGERYHSARIRMRLDLAPMVCERISRAC